MMDFSFLVVIVVAINRKARHHFFIPSIHQI